MNMTVARKTYLYALKNHEWANARRIVKMVLHSVSRRVVTHS